MPFTKIISKAQNCAARLKNPRHRRRRRRRRRRNPLLRNYLEEARANFSRASSKLSPFRRLPEDKRPPRKLPAKRRETHACGETKGEVMRGIREPCNGDTPCERKPSLGKDLRIRVETKGNSSRSYAIKRHAPLTL